MALGVNGAGSAPQPNSDYFANLAAHAQSAMDASEAAQKKLEHPGFWASAYEVIPFTSAKADRENQIECCKRAQNLIPQILEKIAEAYKGMFRA